MTNSTKYFMRNASENKRNFIDIDLSYGEITTAVESVQYSGSASLDAVFVRSGFTYSLLSNGLKFDNSYLTGNFTDYSTTASVGILTVDRTVNGLGEAVKVSGVSTNTFDSLIFANTKQLVANAAPTGLGNLTLTAVKEDSANPAGQAIQSLTGLNFVDADSGASLAGVAVVSNKAASSSQGTWQYSTNAGKTWFAIGTVAEGATALALSAETLVRFVPVDNFNGTPTALTVRALDNSYAGKFSATDDKETRAMVNTSKNGGLTAISAKTNTIGTSITAVNDAPLASGSALLRAVNEDTAAPIGERVTNLFKGTFNDKNDAGAHTLKGVVITDNAAKAAQGKWQMSTGGTTWNDVPTNLSDASALFLAANTKLRFLSAANYNGTPGTLTARLLDSSDTNSTNGATINVDTNGNTTAISVATVTLSTRVTAVNDVPTLTAFAGVIGTVKQGKQAKITLDNLKAQGNENDVEGEVNAFVIKAVSTGTLRIGANAGTATAWVAGKNDTVDGTKSAFWTAAANANGNINAFKAVAKDNNGAESVTAIQAQVSVTADPPPPTPSPTLTSALSGVTNLDVASNLVFTSPVPLKLGTGSISISDLSASGTGFRNDANVNNQTIPVNQASKNERLIAVSPDGKTITINPQWDLDLSSKYRIVIDEGAFVSETNELIKASRFEANFSTVTPGTGKSISQAVASSMMNDAGGLVGDNRWWFDVEGFGDATGTMTQLGDLGDKDYVLVAKNYATQDAIGSVAASRSGIRLKDTNIGVINFGLNDQLYYDSQVNDLSLQKYESGGQAFSFAENFTGAFLNQSLLVVGLAPGQQGSSAMLGIGFKNNPENHTASYVYEKDNQIPDYFYSIESLTGIGSFPVIMA
jgi:hypothetical protein